MERQSTDRSVCATSASPVRSLLLQDRRLEMGQWLRRDGVAQTLLSVPVGRSERSGNFERNERSENHVSIFHRL